MKAQRFWELDAARGIAVLLMIAFHFFFDLNYFGAYALGAGWLFWFALPRAIAGTFIFVAGMALSVSYARTPQGFCKRQAKRGLTIFSWGVLITAVTALALPQGTIWFGILHFFGIALLLAMPLVRYRSLALLLGVTVIAAGTIVQSIVVSTPWLLWLGFMPAGFYTFDYFPLLPWLGVMLLGIAAGHARYPQGRRTFRMKETKSRVAKAVCFLGRNSLIIYLVHQPILIVLIRLLLL